MGGKGEDRISFSSFSPRMGSVALSVAAEEPVTQRHPINATVTCKLRTLQKLFWIEIE
jgi:hypothetical protein